MTRTSGRRHLRVLLKQQFGDQWPVAYRVFWRVWRAMGFPEIDECEPQRAISAMVTVATMMRSAEGFLDGTLPPMTLGVSAN